MSDVTSQDDGIRHQVGDLAPAPTGDLLLDGRGRVCCKGIARKEEPRALMQCGRGGLFHRLRVAWHKGPSPDAVAIYHQVGEATGIREIQVGINSTEGMVKCSQAKSEFAIFQHAAVSAAIPGTGGEAVPVWA